MIVSRAPLRISFAGGLTDIAEYYNNADYGAVLSTTIDKYIYVTVNKKFDDKIRVSYSKTEIVNHVEEIQHPIVREALKLLNIKGGIEITTIGDVPSGTGLGSSSAFTVALLHALHRYIGDRPSKYQLAEEACKIEIDILKEPIGKQDQYATSFGSQNYIRFYSDGVRIEPVCISDVNRNFLDEHMMLFYIGNSGLAKNVLKKQVDSIKDRFNDLTKLKNIAGEMREILNNDDFNPHEFGRLLDKQWLIKRTMQGVSNALIDDLYKSSRAYGSFGGKICGAGNRGFLMLYCSDKKLLKEFMKKRGYLETPFNFEDKGSEIIYEG